MSEKYLHRDDAPFGDDVWEKIDHAVIGAAKSQLSGRRILPTKGPFGLGLKAIPFGDTSSEGKGIIDGVSMSASCVIPLAMIQSEFSLPIRDVAAFEEGGVPLDLGPATKAALLLARQEDELIFNGAQALKSVGLLNTPGVRSVKLKAWNETGAAVEDIIGAATELDNAGFHGPYALALTPKSYNTLFRRYPQGNMTELEHIRQIVTDGVVKAPGIPGGGVLVDTSGPYADIVLGQDMMTGFVGPDSGRYEFAISETVALWLRQPEAVCVLK